MLGAIITAGAVLLWLVAIAADIVRLALRGDLSARGVLAVGAALWLVLALFIANT
jgi:hypothetical protein